jgi:hypothetical protein
LGLALALVAVVAHAKPRIHVRATSSFDVRTPRSQGKLFFLGTLIDDRGQSLANRAVWMSAHEGSPEGAVLPLEPCSGPASSDAHATAGTTWVHTDRGGRFCATTGSAEHTLCFGHLEWSGDSDIDGATFDLTVDPSREQLDLRFDPEPKVLDLDGATIELDVLARTTGGTRESSEDALPILLTNEEGTELGRAQSRAGKATLRLASGTLGAPGRGELRLYLGDALTGHASHVAPVERRATVVLSVVDARGGLLRPADPEDGASMIVTATTTTGTPVPSGIVEATMHGRAVGAAPVSLGRAALVVTFPAEGLSTADLRIRYASDTPWYREGEEVTARLPMRTKKPWRGASLLLSSLGVVLWLALTGRSSRRRNPARSRDDSPPVGEPSIRMVQKGTSVFVGWSGRVVDAHDRDALPGAELRVERPSFTGSEVLATTVARERGRFELRYDGARKGDRLIVTAPFHLTLELAMPACGELEVTLVHRKRALLDRFVEWARTEGAPFPGPLEPTPGSVAFEARVSLDARLRGVEKWAEAVEGAAFGPEPVDARVETEIERMAPHRR